jgi:hypothetical protein
MAHPQRTPARATDQDVQRSCHALRVTGITQKQGAVTVF